MFEAAVSDGAQKFVLQQEVAETGGMNSDVAALLVGTAARHGEIALLLRITISGGGGSSSGGRRGGTELLVRVIDEILLVRHGGDDWELRLRGGKTVVASSLDERCSAYKSGTCNGKIDGADDER